jgi:hypothetical protein
MKQNNLLQVLVISNAILIFLISINGRLFEGLFFSLIDERHMQIFIGTFFILGFISIWFLLKKDVKSFKSFFYTSALCFLIMLISQSFIIKPVEKIHLILFSFFGLFCSYCFDIRKAIIISLTMSIADEILQYFLPERYFGWGDVLINSYASVITILIFKISKKN